MIEIWARTRPGYIQSGVHCEARSEKKWLLGRVQSCNARVPCLKNWIVLINQTRPRDMMADCSRRSVGSGCLLENQGRDEPEVCRSCARAPFCWLGSDQTDWSREEPGLEFEISESPSLDLCGRGRAARLVWLKGSES